MWDIYRLAAGRIEYGVDAYAIVDAPQSYWGDPTVDCSSLYCDSTWECRQLFDRYENAWADLLTGGTARPLRVPARISTRLIASVPIEAAPGWALRALRIDASDEVWLDFDGDSDRASILAAYSRGDSPQIPRELILEGNTPIA